MIIPIFIVQGLIIGILIQRERPVLPCWIAWANELLPLDWLGLAERIARNMAISHGMVLLLSGWLCLCMVFRLRLTRSSSGLLGAGLDEPKRIGFDWKIGRSMGLTLGTRRIWLRISTPSSLMYWLKFPTSTMYLLCYVSCLPFPSFRCYLCPVWCFSSLLFVSILRFTSQSIWSFR